jgi:hypothetical protein
MSALRNLQKGKDNDEPACRLSARFAPWMHGIAPEYDAAAVRRTMAIIHIKVKIGS